ncbi:hypothetical protein V130003_30200 [Vibrio cholerae]|nr:hypothetical protein V130003_30200 [Vibrio cholerae]
MDINDNQTSIFLVKHTDSFAKPPYNARLRGWQRITPNSKTTTVTTATHWDWKRHALTVPLEAFVM